MGLKVKQITLPDLTIIRDVYLQVKNITITQEDYEFYETVREGDIEEIVRWVKKIEGKAFVLVFPDKEARDRQVYPMHWFYLDFEFDSETPANVFSQVYAKLAADYEGSTPE